MLSDLHTANYIFWDISHGATIDTNVFVVYLLMQELFVNKNYFL